MTQSWEEVNYYDGEMYLHVKAMQSGIDWGIFMWKGLTKASSDHVHHQEEAALPSQYL